VKKIVLFLLGVIVFVFVEAQDHCVDAEFEGVYSQYPKTINTTSYAWNGAAWNVPVMKQKKVTGLNIGGTNMFRGLLEYTPSGYVPSNTSKKYPVIIFFHGYGSRGTGTVNQLCKILKDGGSDLATHKSLPGRIENGTGQFTPVVSGTTYEYIVISPQFSKYDRPANEALAHDFPSADEVEDVIDYVVANYNVDERRIFLTGLSNGANMIMEYAASSVARAQRVAAIMPVSLCSTVGSLRNTERGYVPANVAEAGLPVWFVQCSIDNPCGGTPPVDWFNGIKAEPNYTLPRFTMLGAASNGLYECSDTLLHDAWSRAYDPNFKASFVNGTGANDGINMNMYQWFATQQSAVLPVKLKSFTARLLNGKVELNWITTDEKNNAFFTIERSGADQQFQSIATIPGMNNHSGEKAYAYTDNTPLMELSYYRLVQTDIDGKKSYFDIRKIMNQPERSAAVVVAPNPFRSEISAFVKIDKAQRIMVTLTDMTGKTMKTINGVYAAGSTEIKLNALDLPNGIYFLKIAGENISSSSKVIKR